MGRRWARVREQGRRLAMIQSRKEMLMYRKWASFYPPLVPSISAPSSRPTPEAPSSSHIYTLDHQLFNRVASWLYTFQGAIQAAKSPHSISPFPVRTEPRLTKALLKTRGKNLVEDKKVAPGKEHLVWRASPTVSSPSCVRAPWSKL
jgi:hypothetical protein